MPLATKKNTLSYIYIYIYIYEKKSLKYKFLKKKLKVKEKPKTFVDNSIVSNHLWFQMHDAKTLEKFMT